MSSVIFDTATNKEIQTGLRLGAAQYYLARRGGWYELGNRIEVNINGQPVTLDDEAQEREREAALIRLLTPTSA